MKNIKINYDIIDELERTIDEDKFRDYTHYVLWSGGFDSTLLAFNLLQLWKERKITKKIVLIYSKHESLNTLKTIKESESKDKIMKLWKEQYGYEFNYISINTKVEAYIDNINYRNGYFQQYLFISEASWLFDKKAIVHIGHIKGEYDTKEKINKLIHNIDDFSRGETILSIPLNYISKVDIIKEIIKIDSKLMDIIWTCEKPDKVGKNIVPCYYCSKCRELYNTLLVIEHENKIKESKKLITKIIKHEQNQKDNTSNNIKVKE